MSDDVNYINLERLRTFLQEVKRLIPTNYATKTELNNYFPKSGGLLTGRDIFRNVDNSNLSLFGGTSNTKGANLWLYGNDYPTYGGSFWVGASSGDSASTCWLAGYPDGSLTWNNKNIEVIEEQGDTYIRYSNGLQICWGVISGDQFGSYGDHCGTLFSFPKNFVANTQPAISIMQWRNAGNLTQNVNIYALTSSNCGIETDILGGVYFIAIGRWK